MHPIKITVIFTVRSKLVHALHHRISLQTYFQIASCTRLDLDTVMWCDVMWCDVPLRQVRTLDLDFELPRRFSSNGFRSCFHKLTEQNCCVHNLLAFVIDRSNVLTVGGAKTSLSISTHRLIGAYFLTTESDKHIRLLTRLYGFISYKCTQKLIRLLTFIMATVFELLPGKRLALLKLIKTVWV